MTTKSVLIIGGSGFVGTHLAMRLRESYKVFATYSSNRVTIPGVTMVPMNLENRTWIKRVVQIAKPDIIIYGPKEHDRESAEPDVTELELIHSKGVANVVNCAEMNQPKLIYLSTAHVFDGDRGNYREGEFAIPVTPLGKAKSSGENFLKGRSLQSIVVRSSPLFGRGNGTRLTFLDRLRTSLDRGKPIQLPANEIHSFAPVEGLVEVVCKLISKPSKIRLIHYGGLTKMSHLDFGRTFANRFGYDPKLLSAAAPTQHRGERKEILDYSLNSSQAIEQLKIKPLLLEESFDLIEKNLVRGT